MYRARTTTALRAERLCRTLTRYGDNAADVGQPRDAVFRLPQTDGLPMPRAYFERASAAALPELPRRRRTAQSREPRCAGSAKTPVGWPAARPPVSGGRILT